MRHIELMQICCTKITKLAGCMKVVIRELRSHTSYLFSTAPEGTVTIHQ